MAIAVGLDIGSQAVRAAAVDTGGSLPALRRFGEVPLPAGAVVAGNIVDEESVAAAVRALWRGYHLPRKRVIAGVAGPTVAAFRVEVPTPVEKGWAESLPALVEGRLPVPTDEAVLDYVPLEETVAADGSRGRALLVVAVPRGVVEMLLGVTRRAGVQVMSVDLQAFGLVRGTFGSGEGQAADASRALIDIGATLTQVAVVRGGMTRFVRHLPIGGSHFTEALVAGVGMPWEEAEEHKRAVGVTPSGLPWGDEEPTRLSRLLTLAADQFIARVGAALGEYRAEAGEASLPGLVVSGNGARLPHLANRLGRALGTRVEPARVLDHITVGRTGLTESQLLALQAVLPAPVGLALWGSFVPPGAPASVGPAKARPGGE